MKIYIFVALLGLFLCVNQPSYGVVAVLAPNTTSQTTTQNSNGTTPHDTTVQTTTPHDTTVQTTTSHGTTVQTTTKNNTGTTSHDTTVQTTTSRDTTVQTTTKNNTSTTPHDTTVHTTTSRDTTVQTTTKNNTGTTPHVTTVQTTTQNSNGTTPHGTTVQTTNMPQTTPQSEDKPIVFDYTDSKTGKVCLAVNMTVSFNITYETKSNQTNIAVVHLPSTASGSGSCNSVRFTFYKDFEFYLGFAPVSTTKLMATSDSYALNNITLVYDTAYTFFFKDAKEPGIKMASNNSDVIKIPNNQAYVCNALQQVSLHNVMVNFSNVEMGAFMNTTRGKWPDQTKCPADSVADNTVPIVVGAVLAAVVLSILGGYFIVAYRKRRAANTKDYEELESES